MTTQAEFQKDPNAVLDFKFDWAPKTNSSPGGTSDWLTTGETINGTEGTGYKITVSPSGLTVDSYARTNSNTSVTAWLSGGTVGVDYAVSCKIVTSEGRTDERTIHVKVRER